MALLLNSSAPPTPPPISPQVEQTNFVALDHVHAVIGSPDFTTWINITLAAATLTVTGVGVVVAISAVVGYQAARRLIKRQSQKQAEIKVDEYLKSHDFKLQLSSALKASVLDHLKDRLIVVNQGPQPGGITGVPQELKGE